MHPEAEAGALDNLPSNALMPAPYWITTTTVVVPTTLPMAPRTTTG